MEVAFVLGVLVWGILGFFWELVHMKTPTSLFFQWSHALNNIP